MKITLLGATGGTGRACLDQALRRGHTVTVLVRRPAALPVRPPALTVVAGDALNGADVATAVAGADAVISALGTGTSVAPTTLYSDSVAVLVDALGATGVRRLVAVTTGGTVDGPDDPWWYKILKRTRFRHVYADMRLMEHRIHASGLDWTIVRPAYLTNGPHTGSYRTAVDRSSPPGGRRISRADLADFLLQLTEQRTGLRQNLAIAY